MGTESEVAGRAGDAGTGGAASATSGEAAIARSVPGARITEGGTVLPELIWQQGRACAGAFIRMPA